MNNTDPDFMKLFEIFTSAPSSIGRQLHHELGKHHGADPLMVVTGAEMFLFPGDGKPATAVDYRLTQRGFFEMTAVSHLGLAIPYLARLRELGAPGCKDAAKDLVAQCRVVRSKNSPAFWRDTVAVDAWKGLEDKISDLVDYTCAVTEDYLEKAMRDQEMLSFDYMRANLIEGDGPAAVPVSFNAMMAGTFALTALETVHRIIAWLTAQNIRWEDLMVLVCGRAGRPSAGLTWQTNVMCHTLYQTSQQRLDPTKVIIAPTAPCLEVADLANPGKSAAFEQKYREFWYASISSVEMSRLMWPDYPAFKKIVEAPPALEDDTQFMYEMPVVRSIKDTRAIVARLRYVMEDPGAQIASAGMQFVIDQLSTNGNRPELVELPGFTDVEYPKFSA